MSRIPLFDLTCISIILRYLPEMAQKTQPERSKAQTMVT